MPEEVVEGHANDGTTKRQSIGQSLSTQQNAARIDQMRNSVRASVLSLERQEIKNERRASQFSVGSRQIGSSRGSILGFLQQGSDPINSGSTAADSQDGPGNSQDSRSSVISHKKSAHKKKRRAVRKRVSDVEQEKDASGNTLFPDADAMKDKVRRNLMKPVYRVTDLYKESGYAQAIAKNHRFEQLTLYVIAANAIWIAYDTDHNKNDVLWEADLQFQLAENLFCAFFCFEWIVRFLAFRRKRDCMRDSWFVFDSALVSVMTLEVWIIPLVTLILSSGGSGGLAGNSAIVRIARLLRLTRMIRGSRLLRAMPELMILIKGMLSATRSVVFTLVLLIIILYVFGITFTQLCKGTSAEYDYFEKVPLSMYTLFMFGTLLDNVGNLCSLLAFDLVEPMNYIMLGLFFLFILLTALTVMNMLIGVLCEVVSAVAATEKEEMLVSYVHTKLHAILAMADVDKDDRITKKEFAHIMENVEAVKVLQEVGVDVVGLVDFADYIFLDIDGDGDEEEKELSFSKFMEVVLQLRGTNVATVKDIVDMRKLVQTGMETNARRVEVALEELKEELTTEIGEMIRALGTGEQTEHKRLKTEPIGSSQTLISATLPSSQLDASGTSMSGFGWNNGPTKDRRAEHPVFNSASLDGRNRGLSKEGLTDSAPLSPKSPKSTSKELQQGVPNLRRGPKSEAVSESTVLEFFKSGESHQELLQEMRILHCRLEADLQTLLVKILAALKDSRQSLTDAGQCSAIPSTASSATAMRQGKLLPGQDQMRDDFQIIPGERKSARDNVPWIKGQVASDKGVAQCGVFHLQEHNPNIEFRISHGDSAARESGSAPTTISRI